MNQCHSFQHMYNYQNHVLLFHYNAYVQIKQRLVRLININNAQNKEHRLNHMELPNGEHDCLLLNSVFLFLVSIDKNSAQNQYVTE